MITCTNQNVLYDFKSCLELLTGYLSREYEWDGEENYHSGVL